MSLVMVLLASIAPIGQADIASAAAGALLSASVTGSPFRGGSGSRARSTLRVRLAERARLRVEVLRFGGSSVRMLARDVARARGTWSFAWDGRDGRGRLQPDGPYRFRVTATTDDARTVLERWVAKAPERLSLPARGSVVVAINPGHGGSDPGATSGGLEEADINLDIARRVARMLEASGIRVVMTRWSDRDVHDPPVDVDGNGNVAHRDELVARLDVANLARADLTLNIHNNATVCHCASGTETFVDTRRPWGDRSASLARQVQRALVRRLRPFQGRRWKMRDRGLGSGSYVSLSGAPRAGTRPSLMPAILGESLYIDHPGDRSRLASPAVRTAIATAYYEGAVAWLRERRLGVRYSRLEAPASAPAGGRVTVGVRVRATGRDALQGWRLEARLVRAAPVLDGSGARGRLVGSVRLPRIAPGRARDVSLRVTLPEAPGDWIVKLDLVRGDVRLSRRWIVQAQLRVTTEAPRDRRTTLVDAP